MRGYAYKKKYLAPLYIFVYAKAEMTILLRY
jgi:hypothetical protein